MRYLIVSDVHGNWDALRAVLQRVRRKRFDATLLLGDLVGYGGAPNQVMDELGALPGKLYLVRGNHDKVVAGLENGADFNEAASQSVNWTRQRLTPDHLRALRDLPQGPRVVARRADRPAVAICHGSPVHEDIYLFSEPDAALAFQAPPMAHVTFFGHTHVTSMFILHRGGVRGLVLREDGRMKLHPALRYLVNPGSVGQPRDRNPDASFMIYDAEKLSLTWRRVRYPVREAQRRIVRAGLPELLAERLAYGV
jgi:predicted phosphodiesterase